jgi:hypothetical protein
MFSIKGTVVSIGGSSRTSATTGEMWFLATQSAKQMSIPFLRGFKEMMDILADGYDELHGQMWADNSHNFRMGTIAGMSFDPTPKLHNGILFTKSVYKPCPVSSVTSSKVPA